MYTLFVNVAIEYTNKKSYYMKGEKRPSKIFYASKPPPNLPQIIMEEYTILHSRIQKKNPRNVDITTFLGFNPMLFKEHFN